MRQRRIIAIKPLAFCLLLVWGSADAAPVGQVTNLSGPLFALNAEGARRILSMGSQVEPGETLITEGNTYAQVRFVDKGVVTLKPGTQFKIESFEFDVKTPEKDNAVFGLLRGALRTLTGLIGKRGHQDAYRMNTATATIGIRGTQFIAQFIPPETTAVSKVPFAQPLLASLDLGWTKDSMSDVPSGLLRLNELRPINISQAGRTPDGLTPGLYVHVLDGMINVANRGGVQNFSAGQFGFTGSLNQMPIILPNDPGIGRSFTPPPSFQTTQDKAFHAPAGESPPPESGKQQQNKEGCEVR